MDTMEVIDIMDTDIEIPEGMPEGTPEGELFEELTLF